MRDARGNDHSTKDGRFTEQPKKRPSPPAATALPPRGHWADGLRCQEPDGTEIECLIEELDGADRPMFTWRDTDGLLHSVRGPAVAAVDGTSEEWWTHGFLHRDDGQPAMTRADGSREYWREGRRHRDGDRPAVVFPDEEQYWVDGQLHRVGGPAVQPVGPYKDMPKFALRLDDATKSIRPQPVGPHEDGSGPQWFLHGRRVTEKEATA